MPASLDGASRVVTASTGREEETDWRWRFGDGPWSRIRRTDTGTIEIHVGASSGEMRLLARSVFPDGLPGEWAAFAPLAVPGPGPAPTAVRVVPTAESNHVAIEWDAAPRNVAAWEVARFEGARGETGATAEPLVWIGNAMATNLSGRRYRWDSTTAMDTATHNPFTEAGVQFFLRRIDIANNTGTANDRLRLRFSDTAEESPADAGPHLRSDWLLVLRAGGTSVGIATAALIEADADQGEPYEIPIGAAAAGGAVVDALRALWIALNAMPEAARSIDVALVSLARWTGGADYAQAFGRFAPAGDAGWTPVAGSPVPADAERRASDVLERGTADYFYRVRAGGIGGGHSAWTHSAVATLTDDLAVPDVARPAGGPIFSRDCAGRIGRGGVTIPVAKVDANRGWLKTFYRDEANDRVELTQPTPEALTRIWRVWLSIDDAQGSDENVRYFRQVRGTSPIAAVTLWWEGLPGWWIQIPLARRAAGNLSAVGVNEALNFIGIDVAEEVALPTDADAPRAAAAIQAREYGPRWNMPDAAPRDEVSATSVLCCMFSVAQAGQPAAAFLDDVAFTVQ